MTRGGRRSRASAGGRDGAAGCVARYTGPASYLGLDLHDLIRRAVALPLWASHFAAAPPVIDITVATKGRPCRSTGRLTLARGLASIHIVIGLGADRADVAVAVLHELSHAFAGAGHHRRWRQTLRAAAIQMFGIAVAQRIPELRGLDFRELEDAIAAGIRLALGCPPPPDYLIWKPQPVVTESPVPTALCAKWRRAVATGEASPSRPPRNGR